MPPRIAGDTHDVAVQTSAARLIIDFHKTYPEIVLFSDHPMPHDPAVLAQGSLLYYLDSVIDPIKSPMSDAEKIVAKENSNIKGTIRFIDYVNQIPEEKLCAANKKMIFEQLKAIAIIYPSGIPTEIWNSQQEQWSINRFYDRERQVIRLIMTPPAEALNFVCMALFDENRYRYEDEQWEDNLSLRIETVCNHLLALRQQVVAGQLQKCAAGLQHDLLYFLDKSYLDKPRDAADAKPVELLIDVSSFLLESLSAFVADQISQKSTELTTNAMVLAWMNWEAMQLAEENPMIIWLRRLFPSTRPDVDAGWKAACTEYVTERCKDFALDPGECPIGDYVDKLQVIPVIVSQAPILAIVHEIINMKPLVVPPSVHSIDSIYHLMALRNQAVDEFKKQFELKSVSIIQSHTAAIRSLFSVLNYVNEISRYRDLNLFIGAEEGRFQAALMHLKTLLQDYLVDYTLDKSISILTLESAHADYASSEVGILEQNNVFFIENFFALTNKRSEEDWDNAWIKIELMRKDNLVPHPLVLNDAALLAWHQQSESISEDGTRVVDITPYAVNRLLLHGLLVPMSEWSPQYCHYLKLVTDWLLHPEERDGLVSQFKKNYNTNLLINLQCIALSRDLAIDGAIHAILEPYLFGSRPPFMYLLSSSSNLFIDLFYSPISELNTEQRTQILVALLNGNLGGMIATIQKLRKLFELSLEKLSTEQRGRIFVALSHHLDTMIVTNDDLQSLLSLSTEQLNVEQRTNIIEAVKDKLGTIITLDIELLSLFELPLEKLSTSQRTAIWEAVKDNLDMMMGRTPWGAQLLRFLSLSAEQLNADQRIDIWNTLKDSLGMIINSGYHLSFSLSLSPEQLNAEQRTDIWEAVKDNLGGMIKGFEELYRLFAFSLTQLSATQRTDIWKAVKGNLGTIIQSSDELLALFVLSPEQLDSDKRTDILQAVNGNLSLRHSFSRLLTLGLSEAQLNTAQRELIMRTSKEPQQLLAGHSASLFKTPTPIAQHPRPPEESPGPKK